jgi:hypothetical protein
MNREKLQKILFVLSVLGLVYFITRSTPSVSEIPPKAKPHASVAP